MKLKPKTSNECFNLWLGKPAPRYTSFPPAPFFDKPATSEDYTNVIKSLPDNASVSLYVHIPFCRSLCLYCGCNSSPTNRYERITEYLTALKREMELVSAITGRLNVSRLHFGGGTPNMLKAPELRDLFACISRCFDTAEMQEAAMELDPREITEDQAAVLADCGISRVSLGVQDFTPNVQAAVNRIQPYEMVKTACASLRRAGIKRINFDLMYGLPGQTPKTMAETAELAAGLSPDRVSLFSYAHVPQIKKHQAELEKYGLPDALQCLELEQTARAVLAEKGYAEIGIDHFARTDDPLTDAARTKNLRRNFQGYTDDCSAALIGFGASSIGQFPSGYFQNERDETAYLALIGMDELPVKRSFSFSQTDILRKNIIERLMCYFECDIEQACDEQDIPICELAQDLARLKPLEAAGMITRNGGFVSLAIPHRMAIRAVCKAFDPYTNTALQTVASRTA